ncbi:AMP-binding protein [Photobacterium damselae]|uniref:AMP-binding protein n=1 Tax=Photobacterium damselae TaxID=38293 RepID=UPI001EFD1D3B|nr:AMP-binding protein [Photobacterium damselae]MCG9780667.1 AMP-binding protein [Photobacterium damselae]
MTLFNSNMIGFLINCIENNKNNIFLDINEVVTYKDILSYSKIISQKLGCIESERIASIISKKNALSLYASIIGIWYSSCSVVPFSSSEKPQDILRKIKFLNIYRLIIENSSLIDIKLILNENNYFYSVVVIDEYLSIIILDLPIDDEGTIEYQDEVYVLNTSGTTGIPKSIPIRDHNLRSYVKAIQEIFDFDDGLRFSNSFEPNFDLFFHDLVICIVNSGVIVPVDLNSLLMNKNAFNNYHLDVWFSSPSFARVVLLTNQVASKTIRYSLFCGEALDTSLIKEWSIICPGSVAFNLYGPTEVTISCMFHKVTEDDLQETRVPIGKPYNGVKVMIMSDGVNNHKGQLLLSGNQVFDGYCDNSYRNESFIYINNNYWYITGDVVSIQNGIFYYHGRNDRQIKYCGKRIELDGIEWEIRNEIHNPFVFVIYEKNDRHSRGYITVYLKESDNNITKRDVTACQTSIPIKHVYLLLKVPLNKSHKVDYRLLHKNIKGELN